MRRSITLKSRSSLKYANAKMLVTLLLSVAWADLSGVAALSKHTHKSEKSANKNTSKSTKFWINVYRRGG